MDELEQRVERAEGAGAAETPADPDAADGLKAAEAFEKPGAATGFALESGQELVHGGAAGVEEPMQDGAVAVEAEQTLVLSYAGSEKPARVGFDGNAQEPRQGGVAAVRVEPEAAADGAGGPEAEWKRRAEGYALRAVLSEARAAAAAMGVPEDRLDHAARLSELSGIDPEDEGARGKIAEAVRAVLKELPELRGGVGTGQATVPRRVHRDAFERGFLGE